MAKTIQAPRIVGPNLAELTIREQAALAYQEHATKARREAERAARLLAQRIFGNVDIEFDGFISEEFAKRHHYEPRQLVTFDIEGMEFNYVAAFRDYYDNTHPEALCLIDECQCGRGPRQLFQIRSLIDLGQNYERDHSDAKCRDCGDDEKKAKGLAE